MENDGYDYADDSDALLIFLKTADLGRALPIVLEIIADVPVLGNCLSETVSVAASLHDDGEDAVTVYPQRTLTNRRTV